MTLAEKALRPVSIACTALAMVWLMAPQQATAQTKTPYLLPYTISTYAGGGTAPTTGSPCQGQALSGIAADSSGDGCLATSSSVVIPGPSGYDIRVDGQGNVYFTDASSSTKTIVRKIEARTKLVHVFTGNSSKACAGATTSYGDGCIANDGLANVSANFTPTAGATALDIAKNGDVYIGGSTNSVVHKVSAATGLMSVVAGYISGGTGQGGYTGDGGPVLSAEIGTVQGVAVDSAGNIYIADNNNNIIRKVTAATGIITTVVGINPGNGNGATEAYTGDGGPATQATMNQPYDVKVDGNGNIFFVDFTNKCVRVVYEGGAQVANLIALENPSITSAQVVVGDIYTILGGMPLGGTTSTSTSSGKLGTSIELGSPRKLALDIYGNIYVSDSASSIVIFEDGTTGFERTFAGIRKEPTTTFTPGFCASGTTAYLGDGCQASAATLNGTGKSTLGVATDLFGNIYIEDSTNLRIRKVSTNQIFPATTSTAPVSQTLLVHFAPSDTPAATTPYTISTNSSGNADFVLTSSACVVNADHTDDCSLVITFTPTAPGNRTATLTVRSTALQTSTFSLSGTGIAPAVSLDPGTVAVVSTGMSSPKSMVQDGAGNTYVADTGNNRILKITTAGVSTSIAGTGTAAYTGDGLAATLATLSGPKGVAIAADGTIYIADTGNNAVRRIDPVTNIITTVAGGVVSSGCTSSLDTYNDGCPGTQAALSAPAGVAVDSIGDVYISDTGHSIIRELLPPSGYIFLIAGSAANPCGPDPFGNGCTPVQAILNGPTGLAMDPQNDLFIADTGNHEVRELVAATNLITDIAGDGQGGAYGDTGTATAAQLNAPTGVGVDGAGNVYIADTGNNAVRLVNATGDINTVAGTLGAQGTGTVGSATSILLNSPAAVVVRGNGSASILDSGNNRLLSLARTSSTYSFGSVNPGDSSPVIRFQETNTGSAAVTLPSPVFASTAVFSITPNGFNGCTAGQNLTTGSSCYLSTQFSPSALGPASTTVTQTAADTAVPSIAAPTLSLTLSGTGANLTRTTSVSTLTNPATGNPPYGTSFTVTTTITPAACSTTATNCAISGTVTFYVDGVQVGLPVTVSSTTTGGKATGTASGVITGQSEGNHTVVAIYSGDANYESSTAAALAVTVAGAVTTTTLVPTPSSPLQFQQLTLTATVSSPIVATAPTGTVSFYAGTTLLGIAGLNKGVAVLQDTTPPTTLGLYAGTYNVTAVYPGDQNFSASTSSVSVVTVNPDPVAISLLMYTPTGSNNVAPGNLSLCPTAGVGSGLAFTNSSTVGTVQGSTVATCVYVTPSNTVNDTLTLTCTNMPQNSVCTFSPSGLLFTPVPGAQGTLNSQVTLWTDVTPGVIPTAQLAQPKHAFLATLFGWPLLLVSLAAVTMRKRLAASQLFSMLILCGLLTGSSLVMSGCGSNDRSTVYLTPTGTYTVTLTVSGPHTPAQSLPILFTVGPGIPGQE